MALSWVAEDCPKRIDLAKMIPLPLLCSQFHYDQFYLHASSARPRDLLSCTLVARFGGIWSASTLEVVRAAPRLAVITSNAANMRLPLSGEHAPPAFN
jgi:hypothetical protein